MDGGGDNRLGGAGGVESVQSSTYAWLTAKLDLPAEGRVGGEEKSKTPPVLLSMLG